jgi:glucose dehydrogenase
MLSSHRFCKLFFSLVIITIALNSCQQPSKEYTSWPQYKGSNENIHYSSLTQLDTNNVKQLQVAWEYHTGDTMQPHYHRWNNVWRITTHETVCRRCKNRKRKMAVQSL